ncbi:hypothetical protein NIES2100_75030 [Calothrix sp. NIES-2100]|nr:hypothetical protein NIES2100_75030 [Calothrix sp. NIES-2100]
MVTERSRSDQAEGEISFTASYGSKHYLRDRFFKLTEKAKINLTI